PSTAVLRAPSSAVASSGLRRASSACLICSVIESPRGALANSGGSSGTSSRPGTRQPRDANDFAPDDCASGFETSLSAGEFAVDDCAGDVCVGVFVVCVAAVG